MKSKIVSESLGMMATAFSLVAALAWNEAIRGLIDEFIPKGKGVASLFIYASIVTIVAIIIGNRLSRIKQEFSNDQSG